MTYRDKDFVIYLIKEIDLDIVIDYNGSWNGSVWFTIGKEEHEIWVENSVLHVNDRHMDAQTSKDKSPSAGFGLYYTEKELDLAKPGVDPIPWLRTIIENLVKEGL